MFVFVLFVLFVFKKMTCFPTCYTYIKMWHGGQWLGYPTGDQKLMGSAGAWANSLFSVLLLVPVSCHQTAVQLCMFA